MSFSRRPPTVSALPTPSAWALEELAGPVAPSLSLQESNDTLHAPDVTAIAEAAYARGYQDGQLAGVSSEAARVRGALAAIDEALVALQGEADAWVGNARENVCAIAVAVARQVIGRELALDPSQVEALVRRALGEVPVDQPIVVRVHPDDLAVLHSLPADEGDPVRARSDVQWVADPRVARGGCLLEGRDRIIDGRIDTALERLYRRLSDTDA